MSYLVTGDYFVLLQKNMHFNSETKITEGDSSWNKSIFQLKDVNGVDDNTNYDNTNYDTTDMILQI